MNWNFFKGNAKPMVRPRTMIFTSGTLGDTLVLLPVFAGIRKLFPEDEITIFNKNRASHSASPLDLLIEARLVDKIINCGRKEFKIRKFLSFFYGRFVAYDRVFYAQRDGRTLPKKIRQDGNFFRRLSKTGEVFGLVEGEDCIDPTRIYPNNAEMLANRIRRSGLPQFKLGSPFLPKSSAADRVYDCFFAKNPGLAKSIKIAVSIGGKTPIQHYPVSKYRKVLEILLKRHSELAIILIGGEFDRDEIEKLRTGLPPERVVHFQELENDLSASVALLQMCRLYLGNDTGSLHLAAAAGIPCVDVAPSKDPAGVWFPQGDGHIILRKEMPCCGCRKKICEMETPCISRISEEEVVTAVETILMRGNRS